MSNRPAFIIMGAMKAATTTLHDQLAAQPGIFMSQPKEPNFFGDDSYYQQGFDRYLDLFTHAEPGDLCGESSTHYTKRPTFPHAPERIQTHLPDVKLIYIMRDPVERLISQYMHEWSQKTVSGKLARVINTRPELVLYSCYSMQLRPYLEAFGPERILPVFFERLKRYPQTELERVCDFIGYSQPATWQTQSARQNVSTQRMRDSHWRDAIVNAPGLSTLRKTLIPQSARTWVKGLWQMKQRPQLSERARTRVEAQIDQDLAELGRWLGIQLTCQTFARQIESMPEDWCPTWVNANLPEMTSPAVASAR